MWQPLASVSDVNEVACSQAGNAADPHTSFPTLMTRPYRHGNNIHSSHNGYNAK